MNIEKEIEEIDNIVYQNACGVIKVCGTCEHGEKGGTVKVCISPKIAKALIDAGYRKASEVVKEIFERIERTLCLWVERHGGDCREFMAELKKDCGVEVE